MCFSDAQMNPKDFYCKLWTWIIQSTVKNYSEEYNFLNYLLKIIIYVNY